MVLEDFKNEGGLWVKSKYVEGVQRVTASYRLWHAMMARCHAPSVQKVQPTYQPCTVHESFKDFQFFVDWCHAQIGHGLPDYQLDKDLLFKGNKCYGPDTCVFVPRKINNALTTSKAIRGDYPIGVTYHKRDGMFRAQYNTGIGRQTLIGSFNCPMRAFEAYKAAKEAYMRDLAEEFRETIDPRAYAALVRFTVDVDD